MKKPIRILIVEDKADDADLAKYEIHRVLGECEFQVVAAREAFVRELETFQPDVILADYHLPHFDGMKALHLALHHAPLTPLIIWTGSISEDVAVECVKAGASNYILKDNLKRLGPAVIHALEERDLLLARKQAEQKYQSIFENSIEGIFQSSPEGRYLNVNPAMARIYKYESPNELIESVQNIAAQIYVEPARRSTFMSLLDSQNRVEHFEARNYCKDGSIIWTSTSARTVRDANGNILYYEGFLQDITQRKAAEEALQNKEKRFRALIENGLDDISLLAADGALLWESPSTVRNLGYAPDEFVGRNIFELMHPDDLAWTSTTFLNLLQNPKERQRGTFRLLRSDGCWRWMEAIATNMLDEPSVHAIVINYRDITDKKQAEIELQQKNTDLALINALNEIINLGEDLDAVMNLLQDALRRIFASEYTNIYLLDQTRQSLKLHASSIPEEITNKIERLIGRAIPAIEIPIREEGLFQSVLRSGHGLVTKDETLLQKWIGEFVETASLHPIAKAAIRKLLPQIYKILNIKSTILVPLNSAGKIIGVMNVSGPNIFTEQDLTRIENICGQLTTALYRKQVEEALRESQAGYQNLVETSHDLIWSVNAEGRVTFMNRAAREIYGYEPEELIGRSFTELMSPSTEYPMDFETMKEVIGEANEFNGVESSVRHRDGRHIILSANAVVLREESGKITGIVGSSHDVTTRKQTEELLKEERNLLRTLIDHLPDRIYVMDAQGRKTLSNTADWKASGGRTMDDVIGKTDFDLYPRELAEEFWKLDEVVLQSGQAIINYEEPGLDADGNTVSILTTKIPVRDEEGNVVGLVGIGHDITERKHAEESLRQSQNRYRALVETQTDFIVRWQPDGTRTFANEAYRKYFSLDPEQALSESFIPLIHEEDRQSVERKIQRLISGAADIETGVHRVRKPDGSIGWQEWTDKAIRDGQGQLIELQSVGRDITERKQTEAERQALFEIVQGLANTRDLQELLTLVHHAIANVIYAENFFVILHQEGTGLFEEIYSVDQYDPPTPPSKLENSITSYVFRSGTPLLLTPSSFAELAAQGKVKLIGTDSASWLGVPLKTSGRTIGVMAVQDYESDNRYSEREKEFLTSIATQVALVIERKRAEELLRESEERFSSAFEHAAIGMALVTTEGRWSRVNRAVCALLGYTEDELLQKTFQDITHPDDLENDLSYVRQMLTGEINSYQMEKRYFHKDGHVVWVLLSVSMVKDNQGKSQHFISQIQDITERKKAETALRESVSQFRTLFEASPDAIVLIDPGQGWRIIDCNTAACQMNGYTREELLGQCIDIVNLTPASPEDRATFLERVRQDGVSRYETSHRRKDGTIFTVDVSTSLIRFDTGDLVLGIDRDITERKRTEREIHRRANETSALLATSLSLTNLDLETTLQTVGNSANTLFLADGCRIFLMEPDDDTLRCVLALGENTDAFANLKIKLGQGVTGAVAASGKAEIVNEMQHDLRAVQVTGTEEEQEAIMFAPLKERSQTIGILSVRRVGGDRPFQPEDLELLEAFASMAASAVSKAWLFEETQRRFSELNASEERFRQLADNIQEAFWMTDAETGAEIYMSPAIETIWKRSVQTMMYEPNAFVNSVYPEDRHILFDAIERERRGEKMQLEYRIVRPDGTLRWVWDRAFPIMDGIGHVKKIAGISADITERKQSEQELRKLSRAVEQSGSTIIITDTSGRIEYVNPKFSEVTGYASEEVIGQNPSILKSGFTAEREYKQLWQTISSGKEWHGELLNKKKDGTLYWESVTVSPIINDRGEITHYIGVAEDITERKQTEIETRRHLAELEAVYENGLSVGRLLEPRQIGNRLIETFARYLPWHHVTIRLRKEESDDLELVSFNLPNLKDEERLDTEQHFVARINKVGQGLSGWVIQTGVPLRTGNVHLHPQYIDTHAGIQSGLYMPLKVGDRVIGVISVESEAPEAFTEQDERLLATLANQTAIAFENARLYEAMQKELLERKRVEDALRISETHYRALADSITDILFELDQNLHYTHWNKASEVLSGIPASEAIGKSMEQLLGVSQEQTRIKMIFQDVLLNHQPKTFEIAMVIAGENRSFEVNAYPSMRGVSVVAKDVTDRKRAESIMQKRFELMEFSARHSLNELMQRTVDEVGELTGSSIGFFHFLQEDQRSLGIQTWSTNSLGLFEVPAEVGGHLPVDQAGVWADAIRQHRPLIQNDCESLWKGNGMPSGHVPVIREMVIPIIRNERIMAVMGIGNKPQDYTQQDLEIAARMADYAWDITERKQMEIALELERNQLVQRVEERTADLSRANANLARALRVKDEFLANMSHELRTPLNAILGLSESLGEQIAGPLNEKQQKYISTISESGHHLLSLINDILDLAKIDAGQITMDINKVEIHSVCQASLRMIKQLAQKKNQEVSLEIDNGLGWMWADERRLKQMIVNLLGNAVKFTPENGRLGLEVHGDEEANQISFTVWDNGIGIKDEDLARLFQPFVQLDSGLAREATGTGLGLALVAQMARLHGGSVNAGSEPDKGSRFTIVLPWEPALAMDNAARMRVTGKFRAIQFDETNKPTILLVEDTKEVVMMLKDYLELAGYQVFTAQDGVDALVQARHVRPDLILMDIQMPRMDGFETTRKLRSDPGFRYTPIVALTALAMPHDRERCLEAGMDEYISKPVNLKALTRIIQDCLFQQESRTR